MWASWAAQMTGAIALGFLGFLDLGGTAIQVSPPDIMPNEIPIYQFLNSHWMCASSHPPLVKDTI
jgi:hypothetical protein